MGLFNRDSEDDVLNAIEIFDALGSYKNSSNKVYEGKNKISKAKTDRKIEEQRKNELDEIERKKRKFEKK